MIIDTIKLIASELGDMSPKTQLEIVKLCKNLCLAVKDYLVENDDKMSDIEDTIETLEGNITSLSNSISTIESELITAESNINANANAILTINDAIANIQSAITTIQNTLNNVYTKSEVNALLNDIYTKSEVNTLLDLYYTKIQMNELLNGKLDASDIKYVVVENRYTPVSFDDFQGLVSAKIGIIVYNGVRYYKQKVTFDSINDTTLIDLSSFDVQNGICKVLALSSTNYLISPFDSYVAQEVLISGENIKTINGQSLLGSGDLIVGGDKLYQHNISITNNTANTRVNICIITTTQTAFTYSTLADYLYSKLGSNSVMCCGIANGTDVNAICKSVRGNSNSTLTFGTVDGNTFTPTSSFALFDNIFAIN